MVTNPLLTPRRLDGPVPDPTGGRGYADDDAPNRLTRRLRVFLAEFNRHVGALKRHADAVRGFDQVNLNPTEQRDLLLQKTPQDLEFEAGIFSPEEVVDYQRRVAGDDGSALERLRHHTRGQFGG